MAREFNRNMFIMLLSIMIGVVLITAFSADLLARTSTEERLDTKYSAEIGEIEQKNINFTTRFITSLGQLDMAREDRAGGNYNFDLAFIWYTTALSETNETKMESYKTKAISNCGEAVVNYTNSHGNFGVANQKFAQTKTFAHEMYYDLLDLYVDLTASGSKLTLLRTDATKYLQYLTENVTMNEFGMVVYLENVTELLTSFNMSMGGFAAEEAIYKEIEGQIETEYNIEGFSEFREE